MSEEKGTDGFDIVGFGKLAKAIPPKVYERGAAVLLTTFQDLTAPLTQTTAGLGRYLRQKFDNMVETEKSIATYTVEKAIARAKAKVEKTGTSLRPPQHPKSFVKAIEEASKETEPLLHEMWANLIASQISEDVCHPHFVEILSHFGPSEAKLLSSLLPKEDVGSHEGPWIAFEQDSFAHWIRKVGGDLQPWTFSCELLCGFRFADLLGTKLKTATILYRTVSGGAFLSAVSLPDGCVPSESE